MTSSSIQLNKLDKIVEAQYILDDIEEMMLSVKSKMSNFYEVVSEIDEQTAFECRMYTFVDYLNPLLKESGSNLGSINSLRQRLDSVDIYNEEDDNNE